MTEYEVLTHDLDFAASDPPLELPPGANGNRWLREHRDPIALTAPDWNTFRDPDAMTYGSYAALRDDQETYVEALIERFDRDDHDPRLADTTLDYLARAVTPTRYLAHAQQLLSAYLQQVAPASYVANCANFQTADQLRRVQLIAYRTTQLRLAHPLRTFGTGERATWQRHQAWQPIRAAVEHALLEYDWDRALVATQLVVKPVTDLIFLERLGDELAADAPLDSLIAENLWRDSERSRRWTAALLRFLKEADAANIGTVQRYLTEWAPHGHAMLAAGGELLARPGGRPGRAIAAAAAKGWTALLEPAGLTVDQG